jgi:hypothetical protein
MIAAVAPSLMEASCSSAIEKSSARLIHLQGHDHAFRWPLVGDRTAKLLGNAAFDKFAPKA